MVEMPEGVLDEYTLEIYDPEEELLGTHLYDTNSGKAERGICSLPFVRQSDAEVVYFPSNLIENLYLSNGMSAGNTLAEAQVQCLSEIFERAVKREILEGELTLPDVPQEILAKYPSHFSGHPRFRRARFPCTRERCLSRRSIPCNVCDVNEPAYRWCIHLFGAHPSFEVALERSFN